MPEENRNMKNIVINRASLPIAIEEANELLNNAIEIDSRIQPIIQNSGNGPIGTIISANVLIGLSIEIFLKAFMLAGREKGIVFGHNLSELYNELPTFLKSAIELEYKQQPKDSSLLLEIGIRTSESIPERPNVEPFENVNFDDFRSSLDAINTIFVDSRYFFEQITTNEWAIIKYHFASARNIAKSLQKVLEDYRQGKFKGKTGI